MTRPRDRDANPETVETSATTTTSATKDLRASRGILGTREIHEIIVIQETQEVTEIVMSATLTMIRHAAAAGTIMTKKNHEGADRRWSTALTQSQCAGTTANDAPNLADDDATIITLTRRVITMIVDLIVHDVRPPRLGERADTMTMTTASMMIVAMGEAGGMEIATRTNLPRRSRSATTSESECVCVRIGKKS
jgi:hypothetical protein